MKNRIGLKEGIKFHGHLGPYLVLGLLAGELALKKLRAKKYFDLEVKVWGANNKPKSCLIDGLQLSTGATYGKGNISKFNGAKIKMQFYCCSHQKRIILDFKEGLLTRLEGLKSHRDSELLAKKIYQMDCAELFNLKLTTGD